MARAQQALPTYHNEGHIIPYDKNIIIHHHHIISKQGKSNQTNVDTYEALYSRILESRTWQVLLYIGQEEEDIIYIYR